MTNKLLGLLAAFHVFVVLGVAFSVLAVPAIVGVSAWVACCFYLAITEAKPVEPNY